MSYPSKGEIILTGTGFALGFFTPGLFVRVLNTLSNSGMVGGYLSQKLEKLADKGVTGAGAGQAIIYAVLIVVAVLALKKGADVGKKLVIGVSAGIILRVVAIYGLGWTLPNPARDFSTPMNETIGGGENVTNGTTVQGFK